VLQRKKETQSLVKGSVVLKEAGHRYSRLARCFGEVLQMRTRVLDERLEDTFRDWYPDFRTKPESEIKQAA
jgi:hypothetical protein